MDTELTPDQQRAHAGFRAFVDEQIAPHADAFDQAERLPAELIAAMGRAGYLGAMVPQRYGGGAFDMISYGLLAEELGRGSSSVNALLTVHGMCAFALARWSGPAHQERWLPRLATGQLIGAFALTEPEAGSDAGSIATAAVLDGDHYLLNGTKCWITFGQLADLFLVFGKIGTQKAIFLVERDTPGLTVTPIGGMLGSRASMLAELRFEDCRIPAGDAITKASFGFSSMLGSVLHIGRYTVAWNCVGIAQACLEASLAYASQRKQFGVHLKDHQLIQQKIADMRANLSAARLLCYRAGHLTNQNDPRMIMETMVAKYFASTMVNRAAYDAVQIHGANGCSAAFPVQRYLRDARIMEIIEGSSQIQQIAIAADSFRLGTLR